MIIGSSLELGKPLCNQIDRYSETFQMSPITEMNENAFSYLDDICLNMNDHLPISAQSQCAVQFTQKPLFTAETVTKKHLVHTR